MINQNILFQAALGFYENGLLLAKDLSKSSGNKVFEIAPVAAVNLSFSAELLLKLLYNLSSGKTLNDHKLDKIFSCLDFNLQQEIEEKYNFNKLQSKNDLFPIKLSFNTDHNNPEDQLDKYKISTLTLQNLLKLHSDGFIKWRYVYEVEERYYSYEFNFNLMNEFIKALITIIELKYL